MPRDEIRERVHRYMTEPVQPICDACIERALGYEFKTVNPINNDFANSGDFIRNEGVCAVCGKKKLVNSSAHGSRKDRNARPKSHHLKRSTCPS